MKLKLLIPEHFLEAFFCQTFSKTLVVFPLPQNPSSQTPNSFISQHFSQQEQAPVIKDLLKFIYESHSFAFDKQIKPELVYITTEDDFMLPPLARVDQTLEQNQVIKLKSIERIPKIDVSTKQTLQTQVVSNSSDILREKEQLKDIKGNYQQNLLTHNPVDLFGFKQFSQNQRDNNSQKLKQSHDIKIKEKEKITGKRSKSEGKKKVIVKIKSNQKQKQESSSSSSSEDSGYESSSSSEVQERKTKKIQKKKSSKKQESSSESSSSDSSSSSSSEDEKHMKKRDSKANTKTDKLNQKQSNKSQPINEKDIKSKIRNEFSKAFIKSSNEKAQESSNNNSAPIEQSSKNRNGGEALKVTMPKQQFNIKTPYEVQQEKSHKMKAQNGQRPENKQQVERPYLGKFDHLLPSRQQQNQQQNKNGKQNVNQQQYTSPLKTKSQQIYDSIFDGEDLDQSKPRYDNDEGLYNKFTEVYTIETKKLQEQQNKNKASSPQLQGLLELSNYKNHPVVVNLYDFIHLTSAQILNISAEIWDYIHQNQDVCFQITEPDLVTCIPKVSELKLGQITSFDKEQNELQIQLRKDFTVGDEAEEEALQDFFTEKYLGLGLYNLKLEDIVSMWIKVSKQVLPQFQELLEKNKVAPQAPSQEQTQSTDNQNGQPPQNKAKQDFLKNQQENLDSGIRRQMEYYFGDKNYHKDKYIQKKVSENEGKYVPLKEIMSFNQMRKLTNNVEQVVRALEGSKIVEFSEDQKMVRRKQVKQ
eukprot:403376943